MYNQCSVCEKRILSHSPILECDICPNVYHLSCLPSASKSDSIYAEKITKAGCVYHVLKVHFHLTTMKKNMNSMMLHPTYGILFLKNCLLSYCRIKYSTHLKPINLPVYLLIMLILIFIFLMTHCRGIYLRIQIINLKILLMSYIAN